MRLRRGRPMSSLPTDMLLLFSMSGIDGIRAVA